MSRKFDLKELVRVAVIDERSGKELYKKMSERAHNVEFRKKFTWLVGQEQLHQERFESDQLSLQRDMGTVLGESYRPIIDEIINEEISHLVTLAKEKKKLTGQIT